MKVLQAVVNGVHFLTIVFVVEDSHVSAIERTANAAVASSGVLDARLYASGTSRVSVHEQPENLMRKEMVLRSNCDSVTCPAGSHPFPLEPEEINCPGTCDVAHCCEVDETVDAAGGSDSPETDRSPDSSFELYIYKDENCHENYGGMRLPNGASLDDGNCQRSQDTLQHDRSVNAAMGLVSNLMVTCDEDGTAHIRVLFGNDCQNNGPRDKHVELNEDVATTLGEGYCVEGTTEDDQNVWVQIEHPERAASMASCIKNEVQETFKPVVQTVARMVGFGAAADESKREKEKKYKIAGLELNEEEAMKAKIAGVALLPLVWCCLFWCCCMRKKKKKKEATDEGMYWSKGAKGKGFAKGKGVGGQAKGGGKGKQVSSKAKGKGGTRQAKGPGSEGEEPGAGLSESDSGEATSEEQENYATGEAPAGENKEETATGGMFSRFMPKPAEQNAEGTGEAPAETAKSGMFSRFMPKPAEQNAEGTGETPAGQNEEETAKSGMLSNPLPK